MILKSLLPSPPPNRIVPMGKPPRSGTGVWRTPFEDLGFQVPRVTTRERWVGIEAPARKTPPSRRSLAP